MMVMAMVVADGEGTRAQEGSRSWKAHEQVVEEEEEDAGHWM